MQIGYAQQPEKSTVNIGISTSVTMSNNVFQYMPISEFISLLTTRKCPMCGVHKPDTCFKQRSVKYRCDKGTIVDEDSERED